MRQYTYTVYDIEDYDNYRDNVTIDDIINRLNNIDRGWLPDYDYSGNEDDYDMYCNHVAIDKAVDILNMFKEAKRDE